MQPIVKSNRLTLIALGAAVALLGTGCSGGAFTSIEDEFDVPESDASTSPDAGGNDAEADRPDGGEAGPDAADGGADADAEGGDAEAGLPDVSEGGDKQGCEDDIWYLDEDGDGFGGEKSEVGCDPPEEGTWVREGGDCHDGNPDVFPGQKQYFETPYVVADGSGKKSFDYDCDGKEKNDSAFRLASECTPKGLTGCQGDGYLNVNPPREGDNLNQLCGSTTKRVCTAKWLGGQLSGCIGTNEPGPPVGCR